MQSLCYMSILYGVLRKIQMYSREYKVCKCFYHLRYQRGTNNATRGRREDVSTATRLNFQLRNLERSSTKSKIENKWLVGTIASIGYSPEWVAREKTAFYTDVPIAVLCAEYGVVRFALH